eukprot:scaffold583692_cov39-Prasinocladus_malaysianus.AAC.2
MYTPDMMWNLKNCEWSNRSVLQKLLNEDSEELRCGMNSEELRCGMNRHAITQTPFPWGGCRSTS